MLGADEIRTDALSLSDERPGDEETIGGSRVRVRDPLLFSGDSVKRCPAVSWVGRLPFVSYTDALTTGDILVDGGVARNFVVCKTRKGGGAST